MDNPEGHGQIENQVARENTANISANIPTATNAANINTNIPTATNTANIGTSMPTAANKNFSINLVVDYIFWLLVAVTLLRFAFKLIGANPLNPFVGFIYSFTSLNVGIFQGIIPDVPSGNGIMVIEISSLISLVILWLVYRGVLRLIDILRRV